MKSIFLLVAYITVVYLFPIFIVKKNYDKSKEMNEEALAMFSLGLSCQNNYNVKLCFFISNHTARMDSSEPQINEFISKLTESDEQMRKSSLKNFALQVMMSGNEGLAFFVWGLIGDPTFSKLSEFEIARIRTSRELSWDDFFFFAISETAWEKLMLIAITIKT